MPIQRWRGGRNPEKYPNRPWRPVIGVSFERGPLPTPLEGSFAFLGLPPDSRATWLTFLFVSRAGAIRCATSIAAGV